MKTHQLRSLHKFFVGFSNNSFEGMKTHQNRSKSILKNHMCFGRGDQVGPQPLFYYRKLSFPPRKINLQQSESAKMFGKLPRGEYWFFVHRKNVQPKKYLCNIGKSSLIPPKKKTWMAFKNQKIALSIGRGFGHPPLKKKTPGKVPPLRPSFYHQLETRKTSLPVVNKENMCFPMGVSKNRDTPKWMVYNGKPY